MKAVITNWIGVVMTGLLSLLWWDIRKLRQEKDTLTDMVRDGVGASKEFTVMAIKEVEETYIKETTHSLLCENAMLRIEKTFKTSIEGAVKELKSEIRKNGN